MSIKCKYFVLCSVWFAGLICVQHVSQQKTCFIDVVCSWSYQKNFKPLSWTSFYCLFSLSWRKVTSLVSIPPSCQLLSEVLCLILNVRESFQRPVWFSCREKQTVLARQSEEPELCLIWSNFLGWDADWRYHRSSTNQCKPGISSHFGQNVSLREKCIPYLIFLQS